MNIVYGICLIGISILMLIYRENVGRMMPDADWMRYTGGRYGLTVLIGIFCFFWGISVMTGMTGILFRPLLWILSPGASV